MTEGQKTYWGVPAPGRGDLRNFGLLMGGIVGLVVGGIVWYKVGLEAARPVLGVAAAFLVCGLLLPVLLWPLYIAWMGLARVLAFVNTHLLLGLVFYTLFAGIGLAMRLFGRDPLERRLEKERQSYWSRREVPLLPAKHYERQF